MHMAKGWCTVLETHPTHLSQHLFASHSFHLMRPPQLEMLLHRQQRHINTLFSEAYFDAGS